MAVEEAVMTRRSYEGDGITVHWDSSRCIHTGICLRRLPAVFDVGRRPWVDITGADADAIAGAVERCPTGALRYERDGRPEPPPDRTTLVAIPNGPLVVRGDVRLVAGDGVGSDEVRATLCRCGQSRNQPFCDNSHRRTTFEELARAAAAGDPQSPAEVCPPQQLRFD